MLNQTDLKDRQTTISHIVLAAVIFMAVAMPFRALFNLIPNVTEVRPANCLPPLFGLIWGWPGALGAALGNIISDVATGASFPVVLAGFVINFLFGYLPYKLWYSTRVDHFNPLPTMESVKQIIKYIIIMLMASFWITGALALFMEAVGFAQATDTYELFFYNNYDFALIIGVPLLMLLGTKNINYVVPKKSHCPEKQSICFNLLLFLSGLIGFLYTILSSIFDSGMERSVALILLVIMIVFAGALIFKPYEYSSFGRKRRDDSISISLRFKAMIPLLILCWIFIILIGAITYLNYRDESFLIVWATTFRVVGISINLVFFALVGVLYYLEHRIVVPLENLTENVEAFTDETDESDGKIPKMHLTNLETGDEITVLANACNGMMYSIADYSTSLQKITAEKEKIKAELNIAAEIQQAFLPCDFPAFPELTNIDLYATMQPAREVGGDFYDFFMVDDEHLAIVIGDVSGKGVPAALMMMIGKTLIKNYAKSGMEPGDIFFMVNNALCESSDDYFITAFGGILNLKTGEFKYANAGHEMPFIEKRGEPFTPHKVKAGFVLGGMENIQYQTFTTQFEPGTKIFQYTDGVPEATDAKDEMFGMKRLEDVLRSCYLSSPRVILERVKENVDVFVGDAPQFDDLTMICLEYRG